MENIDHRDEHSKDPKRQVPMEVPGTTPEEYPDRRESVPEKQYSPIDHENHE